MPLSISVRQILNKSDESKFVCLTQLSPPFDVLIMIPPCPTAFPLFASANETSYSDDVVPLARGVQFIPPSVVFRMVPESPTAIPLLTSVKKIPDRLFVIQLSCGI